MFPTDTKILILDDSNFARSVLKSGLRDMKFWKILEADHAKTAKNILLEPEQQTDPVELLITDLHMPDTSGLEFLKWMRAEVQYKGMPVVIVSSSQNKNEIMEAGKLNVSNYMIKPFNAATLREKLASAWLKHGEKYLAELRKAATGG